MATDGPMLSELLARRGPLTPMLAVDIATRVAYALAAANRTTAQGLLTTDAIQLTRDGRVIVHPTTAADDLAETRNPYTPPEIIRGELPCPASDVFALGVVLVEMLTGRTRLTKAAGTRLPADLGSIVDCALARDSQDRYPDARSLARTLDAWRRSHFDIATAQAFPIAAPSEVSAGPRRDSQTKEVPARSAGASPTAAPPGPVQSGGTARGAAGTDSRPTPMGRTGLDPSERYPVTADERPSPTPAVRRRRKLGRTAVDPSERYPVEAEAPSDSQAGAVARADRRRRAIVAIVGIAGAAILLAIFVLAVTPGR